MILILNPHKKTCNSLSVGLLFLLAMPPKATSSVFTQPDFPTIATKLNITHTTTFCNCDYQLPLGTLDITGCDTPGKRAVVANFIPKTMILNWIPKQTNIPDIYLDALLNEIESDPLNLTVMADTVWDKYQYVTSFTGTNTYGPEHGACHFEATNGIARISDGVIGEVARTALYIHDEYKIPIPKATLDHMRDIHFATLPTQREIHKNRVAYDWRQKWNPYIEENKDTRNNLVSNQKINAVMNLINRKWINLE